MTEKREDNPRFHEIANMFPLMDEEGFAALVADVDENGLAEPVIMYEDKILDGRNRYLACQQLGIPHREKKFEDLTLGSDDPVAFVWSHNVIRRHLNAGQIAMAAEKRETLGQGRPSKKTSGETVAPKNRKQIAKETGSSPASIAKARNVRKRGTPKLAEAVEQGAITLNAADRIATLPEEEQEKVLADEKPAVAAAKADQARQKRPVARKTQAPAVTMREHMTGHKSGIRDVQLVAKFWADNADEIKDLDEADLRVFIKDLEESRRAAGQLLGLLSEKLIPEWTLPGRQPGMLSTALNKIDLAAKGEAGEGE